MILTFPNAKFYIVIELDVNEVIMTIHRLMHKISLYNTIVTTIERIHNPETGISKYTVIILTSKKHLTSKEISTLFSGLKSKRSDMQYGKG